MPQLPTNRAEEGFTLLELLIAIVVSSILLLAVTTGFIVTMKGTAGAHERFVESNGAQMLATYFTSDVQSANPAMMDTADLTYADLPLTGCVGSSPGKNVARLQWSEPRHVDPTTGTSTLSAFSADYRLELVGNDWQLIRYFCTGTGAADADFDTILRAGPRTTHVVVHDLSDPSDYEPSAFQTGQAISLTLHADQAKSEPLAYSYTFSARMRTPALVPHVASIDRFAGDANPTNAASVRWTVTFTEPVSGVGASDFNLAGSITSVVPSTGPATTYTITATTGADGPLGLNLVDNDSIVGLDGDALGGPDFINGDFTGQTFTIDKTRPRVTIDKKATAPAQADPTGSLPIIFTAVFDESVPASGFTGSDVSITGCTPATATVTGSGTTYSISVAGPATGCTMTAVIPAGGVADAAGNLNFGSTSPTDNIVIFSPAPPTPIVTSIVRAASNPTSTATLRWTVTFDQSVTGVTASDFVLAASAGITGHSITGVSGSGTTWTVTANRGTGYGTIGLNLADGSKTGEVYTIQPAIRSVELLNATSGNPTLGKIEKNDQIVVTFQNPMDMSSVCSAWTGGGNKGPTDVAVTVNDSSTNDSIAVTSSACPTFRFGTLTLGSGGYVSGGAVSFEPTGNNASKMSWDSASGKLTIILGKQDNGSTGTFGAVTSSTATYAPDPAIKESFGGGAIESTSFSVSGRQF